MKGWIFVLVLMAIGCQAQEREDVDYWIRPPDTSKWDGTMIYVDWQRIPERWDSTISVISMAESIHACTTWRYTPKVSVYLSQEQHKRLMDILSGEVEMSLKIIGQLIVEACDTCSSAIQVYRNKHYYDDFSLGGLDEAILGTVPDTRMKIDTMFADSGMWIERINDYVWHPYCMKIDSCWCPAPILAPKCGVYVVVDTFPDYHWEYDTTYVPCEEE